MNSSNQDNQVSPSSTILQLKAEIEKLSTQVQEYEVMKAESLNIQASHQLTVKNAEKTDQFSNDNLLKSTL